MSASTATRTTARSRRTDGGPRPAIRLRRAPMLEPPFDDEQPSDAWAGPGAEQLALDLRPAARGSGPVGGPRVAAPVPEASAECKTAVGRFTRICLEILNGYRPTSHVRSLTIPGQAAAVVEQMGLARERVLALHRRARPSSPAATPASGAAPTPASSIAPSAASSIAPVIPSGHAAVAASSRAGFAASGQAAVAAPARRPGQGHRRVLPADVVWLRQLFVCEPRNGVAEAAAVLSTAGRTWALAVRLESRRGRWLCTAARTV